MAGNLSGTGGRSLSKGPPGVCPTSRERTGRAEGRRSIDCCGGGSVYPPVIKQGWIWLVGKSPKLNGQWENHGKSSHKVAVRCRVWLPKDSDCKISTGPWVEKLQPEHWIRIWLKPGIPQIQHFKSRWKLLAVGKPFFWTHDSSFFPHDKPMIIYRRK